MRLLPWLRLLRLPNLPSAATNVLSGSAFALAQGAAWNGATVGAAAVASVAVYAAGLIFNDIVDLDLDRNRRPERPLPSGEIPRKTAFWLGCVLLVLAAALSAFFLSDLAKAWLGGMALAALLYDFFVPRGSWLGPLLLGICRAANWMLGYWILFPSAIPSRELWVLPAAVAGGYLIYVLSLSFLAIEEDRDPSPRRCKAALLGCFAALLAFWLLAPSLGGRVLLAIAVLGFFYAWKKHNDWTRPQVRKMVGNLILSMVAIDAALALPGFGWWVSLFLVPLILGQWLRKAISPS